MSILVFSTKFCAKCPGVKKQLQAAGIEFEDVDAISYPQLVKEYNVKAVPTIILVSDGAWINYGNDVEGLISGL